MKHEGHQGNLKRPVTCIALYRFRFSWDLGGRFNGKTLSRNASDPIAVIPVAGYERLRLMPHSQLHSPTPIKQLPRAGQALFESGASWLESGCIREARDPKQ
ncbi:hypothetical protein SKAU_G00313440 [Synaphobranchus kaupii]|uniref:Uncharacterized protein n=1 Tax=Synaphobranchus kaupii TaxID=118154 RepID=A0A9Q1ES46_SYNKA|nr:hypothetical protein SKAU_G00313440 [Synaphobranchus kaupii]